MSGSWVIPRAIGEAFQITSDEVLTWDQIYTAIADAVGVHRRHRPHPVRLPPSRLDPAIGAGLLGDKAHSVIFDNSKIRRLVPDFVAIIPFHEGIRRTVAQFEADPSPARS